MEQKTFHKNHPQMCPIKKNFEQLKISHFQMQQIWKEISLMLAVKQWITQVEPLCLDNSKLETELAVVPDPCRHSKRRKKC